jgi:two-component system response regulator DegU
MEEVIRVILTEDKEQYRKVLRELLSTFSMKVIAEAENGWKLIQLLEKMRPDVVLLDLEMPVMDGNAAFDFISKKYPLIKVIILSLHYEELLIENYLDRGAKGYLPKDAIMGSPELLINAIRKVHQGGKFIYEYPSEVEKFSQRQKEILPLIFEGLTNEAIANETGISVRAVEKQRQKMYKKSGSDKVINFYKYAFSKGLQFLGRNKPNQNS